jgi:hypothetical protein
MSHRRAERLVHGILCSEPLAKRSVRGHDVYF